MWCQGWIITVLIRYLFLPMKEVLIENHFSKITMRKRKSRKRQRNHKECLCVVAIQGLREIFFFFFSIKFGILRFRVYIWRFCKLFLSSNYWK